MWCNRCKQPQYQRKQFVQQMSVVPERPVQPAPADEISIKDARAETQSQVYAWLFSKGLIPEMVPNLRWSDKARRMIFPVSSGMSLGRGLSPLQNPKWIQYNGKSSFAYVAPLKQNIRGIVLTEDLLSAYKVAYVSNHFGTGDIVVCAMLGTRLDSKLKLFMAQNGWPVLLMLDGDKAGYDGVKRVRRELKAFLGLRVQDYIVDGNDPKDLSSIEILRGLDGCFNCKRDDESQSSRASAEGDSGVNVGTGHE